MSTSESVVVWGEVLWDRFPDGDQLGGAPANVAWHLGQVGSWVQLVSRVGADPDGARAIERLEEFVDVSLIQVDAERATGEVRVALEGGEPRYTLVPGRAWERIACTPLAAMALGEAGVVMFGSLAQRTPDGLAGWRAAMAATTALRVCDLNLRPADVAPTPAIEQALAAADILKVNDRELGMLATWFGWRDPVAALRRTARRLVVVTHGAAGSTLHGEHGAIEIAATPAPPGGDNVGCGDAYLAMLVHGLGAGLELAACGALASRYAAAVAGVRGATPRFDEAHLATLLEPA